VTVVQLTALQYTVPVNDILSQVVSVYGHCIITQSVNVQFFIRVAFSPYVVALARIVFARIVSLIKVNQSISVKVLVCAPDAAIDTLVHTQSVKVHQAKQYVIVRDETSRAVVGLFQTHTFVKFIGVATSDNSIQSINQLLLTCTEYA